MRFRSLTENMDTTTSGNAPIFNVFAAMIRERTNAGLQTARARGQYVLSCQVELCHHGCCAVRVPN
ncbi:hypothetical protein [Bifidobacterium aquikefiricola]|uniref:hypothetical protein n=1 Tax=Bifidobacterium TaxID=1678 RepID=UPI0038575312